MPLQSGPFDSGAIAPVCKTKENLSIWTAGKWAHYRVDYQEGLPPGPASMIDMVAAAGATTLGAAAIVAKQVVQILQLSATEFVHCRFEPIDNVECLLWELGGQQKLMAQNIHCRVDRNTVNWDPHLSTTTFFVLGQNRDMNLEVRNVMNYAIPVARVLFWGDRGIVTKYDFSKLPQEAQTKLDLGDVEAVREYVGQTTWIPAEGRQL